MKVLLLSVFVFIVSSVNLVAETARYKSCSFSGIENVKTGFLILDIKGVEKPAKQTYKYICNAIPNKHFKFLKKDNIENAPLKIKVGKCNFIIREFVKNKKFIIEAGSIDNCRDKKRRKRNTYTFWSNSGKEFKGECSNGRTFAGVRDSRGYYIVSGSKNGNGWGQSKDKAIRDACGF